MGLCLGAFILSTWALRAGKLEKTIVSIFLFLDGQGVVEHEVLDLILDTRAARVGVVLQPTAVADLNLASEGFDKGLLSAHRHAVTTCAANFVELKVHRFRSG